jgi:hypothetical protein
MPKGTGYQAVFSAGELSPNMRGRSDTELYNAGGLSYTNMQPLQNGTVTKTQGFQAILSASTNTGYGDGESEMKVSFFGVKTRDGKDWLLYTETTPDGIDRYGMLYHDGTAAGFWTGGVTDSDIYTEYTLADSGSDVAFGDVSKGKFAYFLDIDTQTDWVYYTDETVFLKFIYNQDDERWYAVVPQFNRCSVVVNISRDDYQGVQYFPIEGWEFGTQTYVILQHYQHDDLTDALDLSDISGTIYVWSPAASSYFSDTYLTYGTAYNLDYVSTLENGNFRCEVRTTGDAAINTSGSTFVPEKPLGVVVSTTDNRPVKGLMYMTDSFQDTEEPIENAHFHGPQLTALRTSITTNITAAQWGTYRIWGRPSSTRIDMTPGRFMEMGGPEQLPGETQQSGGKTIRFAPRSPHSSNQFSKSADDYFTIDRPAMPSGLKKTKRMKQEAQVPVVFVAEHFEYAGNDETLENTENDYENQIAKGGHNIDTAKIIKLSSTGGNAPAKHIGIWQSRLVLAGSAANPMGIWMSGTNDTENFAFSSGNYGASDAILLTLTSDYGSTEIKWIKVTKRAIICGCDKSEIVLRAVNGVVSAMTLIAEEHTSFGSSDVPALATDSTVIFSEADGTGLREYFYNNQQETYQSPSLTTFANHLFSNTEQTPLNFRTVKQIALVRNPVPTVYAVTFDGRLCGMTYDRSGGTIGWFQRKLITSQGDSGEDYDVTKPLSMSFQSIGVSSSPYDDGSDALWAHVRYHMPDGTIEETIEVTPPATADYYLTCGLVYDASYSAPYYPFKIVGMTDETNDLGFTLVPQYSGFALEHLADANALWKIVGCEAHPELNGTFLEPASAEPTSLTGVVLEQGGSAIAYDADDIDDTLPFGMLVPADEITQVYAPLGTSGITGTIEVDGEIYRSDVDFSSTPIYVNTDESAQRYVHLSVGFEYEAVWESMPIVFGDSRSRSRAVQTRLGFADTQQAKVQVGENQESVVDFRILRPGLLMGDQTPPLTGEREIDLASDFEDYDTLKVKSDTPTSMTLLRAIIDSKTGGG